MTQNSGAAMDLQQRLDYARGVVGGDPMARFLGIEIDVVEEALATVSLQPGPQHLNAVDRVHGSAIYALIDQALAVAANTLEFRALVMESKVNFIAAAAPDAPLRATARPRNLARKIGLWEVEVTQGETVVALAQGLTYHAPRPKA